MISGHISFSSIISCKSLFSAWKEFKRGKEKKLDVQRFTMALEENIFSLYRELQSGTYKHSLYDSFYVHDPKLRLIHKAEVRDRILHHAIVRVIEPLFEKTFIFDSYSSRKGKGTHRAVIQLRTFAKTLSVNHTKTVWALQCDIRKFFDSVDHDNLHTFLQERIDDKKLLSLLGHIIASIETRPGKGVPLGNLTSQLFSNVYLNPLDQFIKQTLGVEYYIRYADDFVILSTDSIYLQNLIKPINQFLKEKLTLSLHEKKLSIRKWHQGLDFLGYVSFPHHTILRTKTKKRMLRKIRKRCLEYKNGEIDENSFNHSMQSYRGMLTHCRGRGIEQQINTILKTFTIYSS